MSQHNHSEQINVSSGIFEEEPLPIWVGEFDTEAAKVFCNALFRASEKDANKPIAVYINSGGGDISGLLAMLSAMDTVPNKVITVAMGFAMSAGAILLAHGDMRFVSPHARVMVHKIQAGAFGNMDDILNEAEWLTNVNDYVMGILAADCKTTKKAIETALSGPKREVYLNPTEAVGFGLADMVGIPKILQAPNVVEDQYLITVMGADAPKTKKKKPKKASKR